MCRRTNRVGAVALKKRKNPGGFGGGCSVDHPTQKSALSTISARRAIDTRRVWVRSRLRSGISAYTAPAAPTAITSTRLKFVMIVPLLLGVLKAPAARITRQLAQYLLH